MSRHDFGPRYTWSPTHARYALFGKALAGEAFGLDSFFPGAMGVESGARSLAVKAGGGMNLSFNRRVAVRLFEADYLRTQLPNSTNNIQNNVSLGAGIVWRLQ